MAGAGDDLRRELDAAMRDSETLRAVMEALLERALAFVRSPETPGEAVLQPG